MKKSLLLTLEFPPQMGGVSTYYYQVCKNLPPDKIVVLAPAQKGSDNFDARQNFPIIRDEILAELVQMIKNPHQGLPILNKFSSRLRRLKLLKSIRKIIKAHRIEMIQVGNILPLGAMAYLINRRDRLPYLVYTHGMDILMAQKTARKKIILDKILSRAKSIIANSHFTSDQVIKLGAKSENIAVIYPCPNIDHPQISEWKIDEVKEKYGLKGKKIMITVGRLVPRKGHDLVIQALPYLIKKIPDIIYLIIGQGPNRLALEELVNKNNLRDYVKFLSEVPSETLPALYQVSNVLVMPSRQIGPDVEGFGIVYLEANLFSKPVIGGRSGGISEAVIDGKTGLLVNPNSVEDLTEAINKILTNPSYAERLGMQGMERVINQFDWKVQTEKIKNLLE